MNWSHLLYTSFLKKRRTNKAPFLYEYRPSNDKTVLFFPTIGKKAKRSSKMNLSRKASMEKTLWKQNKKSPSSVRLSYHENQHHIKCSRSVLYLRFHSLSLPRPRGDKTFFMLNSVEHEILNAHKYKNIKKFGIF